MATHAQQRRTCIHSFVQARNPPAPPLRLPLPPGNVRLHALRLQGRHPRHRPAPGGEAPATRADDVATSLRREAGALLPPPLHLWHGLHVTGGVHARCMPPGGAAACRRRCCCRHAAARLLCCPCCRNPLLCRRRRSHASPPRSGKYGEWRFDKRSYSGNPPPRNLGEPPPGMKNELVRHLIHAINEASNAIPGGCHGRCILSSTCAAGGGWGRQDTTPARLCWLDAG